MAFTRFHDDPARIQKQLQEMSGTEKYQLNKPGNGLNMPYFEDPHIRLQKWGANLRNNTVDLESDFWGITNKLTHDLVDYKTRTPNTMVLASYGTENAFVDESRSTHPAWMFRDLEQSRHDFLLHDYQSNTEIPFENNASTRIAEKDIFSQKNNNTRMF